MTPKTKAAELMQDRLRYDLNAKGFTPFQIEVYLCTSRIPTGETRSYLEVARAIGKPKAARSVGSALKKNPFPGDRVPCHRVIHSNGNPTGFMGSTDPDSKENRKKRRLLAEESASIGRVREIKKPC